MQLDLDKLAKKRQYKLRGKLVSVTQIKGNIYKILVTKGAGKDKKFFCFTAFNDVAVQLSQLQPNYRLKMYFSIRCRNYGQNWFTELIVESFEYWEVNEDKKKKEAYLKSKEQDHEYSAPQTENTSFLNQ